MVWAPSHLNIKRPATSSAAKLQFWSRLKCEQFKMRNLHVFPGPLFSLCLPCLNRKVLYYNLKDPRSWKATTVVKILTRDTSRHLKTTLASAWRIFSDHHHESWQKIQVISVRTHQQICLLSNNYSNKDLFRNVVVTRQRTRVWMKKKYIIHWKNHLRSSTEDPVDTGIKIVSMQLWFLLWLYKLCFYTSEAIFLKEFLTMFLCHFFDCE